MLKKEFRLPKIKFKAEKTFNLPDAIIKVSENGLSVSRFGFVVSKKVDNRAVVRNKTKRILRSFIQENLENIKTGFDFLIISRKVPKEDIGFKITEVFKKEGYLK